MHVFAPTSRPVRRLCAALATLCALLTPVAPALAQSDEGLSSNYAPIQGQPFFVLTDTQYGSQEEARVRVEIPASDGGRAMVEAYGGVDIVLYGVPHPLDFLRHQHNLHRVEVGTPAADEGLTNTVGYLWDNWWKKSRFAWRDVFSAEIRQQVTKTAPVLHSTPALNEATQFRPVSNFKPLKGFDLIERFRYPLWQAKPIQPPAGVKLEGSSSDFIAPREGNIHVPLGKLKPGLYLVEAIIGKYRAVTLVFVSDSVAVTKIASGALTVWTAARQDGHPVRDVKLAWTDGTGTLKSAETDAQGLATLEHVSPEHTYLLGEDPDGGVFVSENFYYDSEIYNTKLYAVTDRPLYRPGDLVQFKLLGRHYESARSSRAVEPAEVQVVVNDPNGNPVLNTRLPLDPLKGADSGFRLPDNASAGGYEIRMTLGEDLYSAAFRVAEYVKPHFTIDFVADHPAYKTGEAVSGTLKLSYPDGKPVANATIDLSARAQNMTMVEGELRYAGLFPIQLSNQRITSDAHGEAKFALPPAREPSRLILSALATDGAAFRVRTTRELLVERAAASWRMDSARQFSAPGEPAQFTLSPVGENAAAPVHWEAIRLEDRHREEGTFPGGTQWSLNLPGAGSYSITLRDQAGNVVAATTHWVSGKDMKVPEGSIEMVTDKPRYAVGDTAEVLLSFPQPVDEALLTLERDRVEATALLSRGGSWVHAERLNERQWRLRLPVQDAYAPNMTLSAVFVRNGEYVFQNAGIVVTPPQLALDIRTSKAVVAPGEMVDVDIDATLHGQAAPAALTVSVVDEMIYALQPEIAPDLRDFLLHPRRNNVRTSASLSFITYDEAADASADAANRPPPRHGYNERGVKVLERPRRDETDTAAWAPTLLTDAQGHAHFSFRMPDSLSRWRITVRAIGTAQADGVPGQSRAFVRSDKAVYAKWTSPNWLRDGDRPDVAVAVFNNGEQAREADLSLQLGDQTLKQHATLPRGVSYVHFALPDLKGATTASLKVEAGGQLLDALDTRLQLKPAAWRSPRQQIVPLTGSSTPLTLPADAEDLRFAATTKGSAQFMRIAEDLVEYPYGCVEQTSSRLIPLALATRALGSGNRGERLRQLLYTQRQRLAALAGPEAVFGWWGRGTGDNALMTAYAYFADWNAAQVLNITLPASHWERVLDIYRQHAAQEPLLHQALTLWLTREMGLPVATQTGGLLQALAKQKAADPANDSTPGDSPLLANPDGAMGQAFTLVLADELARSAKLELPGPLATRLVEARARLAGSDLPVAHALLVLTGQAPATEAAGLLDRTRLDDPTFDRALTLVWLRKALGALPTTAIALQPTGNWEAHSSALGEAEWRWSGPGVPNTLELASPAPAEAAVVLRYASKATEQAGLPLGIERHIYRLEAHNGKFARVELKAGEAFSTDALYLDEITLKPQQPMRYAFVEAALPPGAEVESTTWGVLLEGGEEGSPLEASRAQSLRGSYGVPVDVLDKPTVLRHLLRFGQRGSFELPPPRAFRMYQPEQKAFGNGGKNLTWSVH